MLDLDDQGSYGSIDKSGMGQLIRNLPAQCRQAWEKASQFKPPADYSNVDKIVILGMGGSAIGGDLLKAAAGPLKKQQITIQRDYNLPDFVDSRTLVIASSYSGNTEETLSGFNQALNRDCKKIVFSTGGKITALAHEHSVPVFVIDHVSPPRAALGYSLLPLLAVMQNLDFIDGKSAEVESALSAMQKLNESWQENAPQAGNQAKKLAMTLYGKIPVIYCAGILTDVGRRWKTQINENSKAWAFFEVLPELNHNAVLGYSYPADMKDKMYVLFLRCPALHPRTLVRYNVTGELLERRHIPYQYIDSEGSNDLKHVLGLVLLGDWVSYYLALLYGIDPSPVPEIDLLKQRLAEAK
jgi:glucose/mannose-6-phosphate isomerase